MWEEAKLGPFLDVIVPRIWWQTLRHLSPLMQMMGPWNMTGNCHFSCGLASKCPQYTVTLFSFKGLFPWKYRKTVFLCQLNRTWMLLRFFETVNWMYILQQEQTKVPTKCHFVLGIKKDGNNLWNKIEIQLLKESVFYNGTDILSKFLFSGKDDLIFK